MKYVAVVALIFCMIALFGGPFLIGKVRKPYDATWYLLELVDVLIVGSLCGRVLGWW